jgi:hypothetical protein
MRVFPVGGASVRGFVHVKLLCKQLKLQAWCIHGVVCIHCAYCLVVVYVMRQAIAVSMWLRVVFGSIAPP